MDYPSVARLLRRVLEPMSSALVAGGSSRREGLARFLTERPEISAYSVYRASRERGSTPPNTVAPPDEALRDPLTRYYAYCQWAAAEQLERVAKSTRLYSDLPVGTHPDGFDPHWSAHSFVADLSTGSPPDLVYPEGQNWMISPFHPERIRDDAYAHPREVLARAFRAASYVRIDHIMGLQRLYVIPAGHDATGGTYLAYRPDEFYSLVALEASRAGASVIGEDLGTTPPGIRKRMAKSRILRSWVFEFESRTDDPLPDPAAGTLVSLSTHDTPRFNSFLWGGDIDELEDGETVNPREADVRRGERALYREALFSSLGIPVLDNEGLTTATRRGCLAHLAQSRATLVLVDLEELLGEREPQNRPGTTQGNWTHRATHTLEEMSASRDLGADLEMIARLRRDDS